MDVAIKGGQIARVAADIPPADARGMLDARGKIVCAGLIDSHAHVYDGLTVSIDPDIVGIPRGVTTIVDGGSAGAPSLAGFRKHVIERAHTRIYALLNIGMNGCCLNEIYGEPRLVDPRAALAAIEQHRSDILGIKVRINGRHQDLAHDIEVMKKAREVADATSLP
jgi:dihydroorotase